MPHPLRLAARILTGSTYALLGVEAVRDPDGRVDQTGPAFDALRKVVPPTVDDTRIVQGTAVVQVLSGTMLALGKLPRLSALALAGSLIPTTTIRRDFWKIDDPAERSQLRTNMAMLGGLLFAVLDRPAKT